MRNGCCFRVLIPFVRRGGKKREREDGRHRLGFLCYLHNLTVLGTKPGPEARKAATLPDGYMVCTKTVPLRYNA